MSRRTNRILRDDWYTVTTIVSAVVHTVVVLCAVGAFATTSRDVFLWSAIASWAVLGGVVGAAQFAFRPPTTLAEMRDLNMRRGRLGPWALGVAPLVQAPLVFLVVWLLTMSGTGVDVDYLIDGDGVPGILTTFGLTVLVAYGAELAGLLAVLVVGFPLLIVLGGVVGAVTGRRGGLPMLGVSLLVLGLVPFAVAGVLGVEGPDGESSTILPILVLLGFDVHGYEIVSQGWTWTARIVGASMVLLLAALIASGATAANRPKEMDGARRPGRARTRPSEGATSDGREGRRG